MIRRAVNKTKSTSAVARALKRQLRRLLNEQKCVLRAFFEVFSINLSFSQQQQLDEDGENTFDGLSAILIENFCVIVNCGRLLS